MIFATSADRPRGHPAHARPMTRTSRTGSRNVFGGQDEYRAYAQPTFRVGDWTAIPARRLLRGPDEERVLEPRVMDLLICLARHAGDVVSGDQLVEEVWHGTIVSDSPIYQTLAKLRKALGDDRHHPQYIETIAKRGYRLIAPVSWDEPSPDGPGRAVAARRRCCGT